MRRRCISYLTIEHKGPVDLELAREKDGQPHLWLPDDCLAVCPWNKFPHRGDGIALCCAHRAESPPLKAGALDLICPGSCDVRRIPHQADRRDRFVRNVLYAIRELLARNGIEPRRARASDGWTPDPTGRGWPPRWACVERLR